MPENIFFSLVCHLSLFESIQRIGDINLMINTEMEERKKK